MKQAAPTESEGFLETIFGPSVRVLRYLALRIQLKQSIAAVEAMNRRNVNDYRAMIRFPDRRAELEQQITATDADIAEEHRRQINLNIELAKQ